MEDFGVLAPDHLLVRRAWGLQPHRMNDLTPPVLNRRSGPIALTIGVNAFLAITTPGKELDLERDIVEAEYDLAGASPTTLLASPDGQSIYAGTSSGAIVALVPAPLPSAASSRTPRQRAGVRHAP